MLTRRTLIASALAAPAAAQVDLGFADNGMRPTTRAFPQKGEMILQRSTPPLLETPLSVFDANDFTPNDRFFVRWHYPFPLQIDPAKHRLRIAGHVAKPLSLSLADLARLPRVAIAAVNQCAGNGRGLFSPRVAGAQWANGAMGNALWEGVRLKDVLALAGVKAGAVAVRCGGLDTPLVDNAPDFEKSLPIDHALSDDVLIAWSMNGTALPLLNGFPLRLVVPGWYSTYWVKMLDAIEVLAKPDDGYWMAKAYLQPANALADIAPGAPAGPRVPVTTMRPRALVTNIASGTKLPARALTPIQGVALGGDHGVTSVELSADAGRSWVPAQLGPDHGRYSFRRFRGALALAPGRHLILARAKNAAGVEQPLGQNWNPSGYNRAGIEPVAVEII
ncbi:oxidase [Sandarakinorhabdus cyanobacteriorum]|uniref:Oxidase n=1 Tax=Sandarakinorhabdus cyanobacteriorum TaxID=1981098 RepID=A0A255Y739_9SPHN|nr:molybdopterin-dependent oxidoreductase [Sandarakinorhabdus cyanobacteriorum]OYQ25046.1 oxidase [Sandarakinorhabdus cyanobacteriorum]